MPPDLRRLDPSEKVTSMPPKVDPESVAAFSRDGRMFEMTSLDRARYSGVDLSLRLEEYGIFEGTEMVATVVTRC